MPPFIADLICRNIEVTTLTAALQGGFFFGGIRVQVVAAPIIWQNLYRCLANSLAQAKAMVFQRPFS